MTIEQISAPSPVTTETESTSVSIPASEVTASSQEQSVSPQETEGTSSSEIPAGQESVASKETEKKSDDLSEGQQRRKERNQQRWQEMKRASERVRALESELQLYRPPNVDYSQITDPDEVIAERTASKLMERQAQAKAGELRSAQQAQAAVLHDAVEGMLQDGRERMPDFDQVFNSATPIHSRAVPFIVESDKGAEIAYYLGKNPAVAQQLSSMFDAAPARALVELGRIEARLSAPPSKTPTKAPAPAPVLNGGRNPLQFDANRASVDDMASYLKKAGIIA